MFVHLHSSIAGTIRSLQIVLVVTRSWASDVRLVEEPECARRHGDRDDRVGLRRRRVPLPSHLDRTLAHAEVEEVGRPDRADALQHAGDATAEARSVRDAQHHCGVTEGARGALQREHLRNRDGARTGLHDPPVLHLPADQCHVPDQFGNLDGARPRKDPGDGPGLPDFAVVYHQEFVCDPHGIPDIVGRDHHRDVEGLEHLAQPSPEGDAVHLRDEPRRRFHQQRGGLRRDRPREDDARPLALSQDVGPIALGAGHPDQLQHLGHASGTV